jgi:hypothetical protein
MTFAHIGGMPIEETMLALGPAGAAMISMVMMWLRRR